jgi:Na+/proline symporter
MMSDGEHESKSHVIPPIARQYTVGSAAQHRSTSSTRRFLFFGLASIWGFIVGIAGLLAAMDAAGQHLESDARVAPSLILALLLAAAGGLVVAAAYRESKRRSR